MMGKTHRLGGVAAAFTGYLVLQSKDLTITNIHPIAELAIIYPFAVYGSTAPDLDHNKQAIPSRDPVSLAIWWVLHIGTRFRKRLPKKSKAYEVVSPFACRHRSWQTHSDLTLLVLAFATWSMLQPEVVTSIFGEKFQATGPVVALIGIGLGLGLISHILLDSITKEGIPLVSGMLLKKLTRNQDMPTRLRFVPEKSRYFKTGDNFEDLVYKVLRVLTWLQFAFVVISVVPPYLTPADLWDLLVDVAIP